MMNIEDIKTIVKLMGEYQLTEFSVEAEGCNVRIRRDGGASAPTVVHTVAVPAPAAGVPAAAAVPAAPAAAPAPASAAPAAPAGISIESPLVGTFYAAPSPDMDPFVKVGDKVTPDTVICIIEAMKVMNEVKAEKSGVVKEIVAQNGQPVEYGQILMVLE